MENNEYYAYDVSLNDNNELFIVKYKVVDETFLNTRRKIESVRKYNYAGFEIPDNIQARIEELTLEGYLPINRFKTAVFDLVSTNPLVNAKMLFLGFEHRLLEKVYSLGSGYDDMNLTTYITYINLKTGKISFMKVNSYGYYNEDKIKELEENGYVPVERSFYNSYKNTLNDSSEIKR